MGTTSSDGHEGWILPWWGFILGLCLLIPTLVRFDWEGWTGVDIFFAATGTVLVIACVSRLGIILSRARHYRAKAETEGRDAL
jgi:hypothetical protein